MTGESGSDRPEVKRALEQIRAFQRAHGGGRFRLEIPVWRLTLEGLAVFAIAFVSGLGLAVLFNVFRDM